MEAMSEYQFVYANSESARRQTYEFLRTLLPHDDLPALPPEAAEREQLDGKLSPLVRAEVNGQLVGAAFIGPSWEDVSHQYENGQMQTAWSLMTQVQMLHGLAVAPGHRGSGLGSMLLTEAERAVSSDELRAIIGVANGDARLDQFYRRNGYDVGDGARPLMLRFASEHYPNGEYLVLPQDQPEARWILKHITQPVDGNRRPVRASHPSDKQLEMIRASSGGQWA
jgi:GNAT superfamily N-acetyltransferase